jgi:hypothetical protein
MIAECVVWVRSGADQIHTQGDHELTAALN